MKLTFKCRIAYFARTDEKGLNILAVHMGRRYFDLRTKAESLASVSSGLRVGQEIEIEYESPDSWKILNGG